MKGLPAVTKMMAVLTACLLCLQWLQAQEIGLELYTLRNKFKTDVPGALATIKSWGIHEIEGGGTYGLPMKEYKNLLAQNGLKMIGVSADFDTLSANPQAVIDAAKAFGAKYIVCFWIPHNGDDFTIEDIKKAAAVFNAAGRQIHAAGLSFCYHPHGYEFRPYEGGTLFDYLVKNTNPKYVNFEMDVFWVKQPGQDPVALMKKYASRFLLLHLKDRKKGTTGNQNGRADDTTNVVLGQGDVNIAAVMQEAKKIGIKHYFIEDESLIPEQQVPQSLKYVRSLK